MRKDRPKKPAKRLPDPEPRPEDKADTEPPDRRAAIAATKAKHREGEALVLARRVAVEVFRERFDPFVMHFLDYMGGKGEKRAKTITSEINALRKPGKVYLEPFCGGGAILCKMDDTGPRAASDGFALLIDLLKAIQKGWTPPKFVSRRSYNIARDKLCKLTGAPTYKEASRRSAALKPGALPVSHIWALFAASFNNTWMNSYGVLKPRGGKPRTQPSELAYARLHRRLEEMSGDIKDIQFFHRDYRDWLPHDAVIYADPPYADTEEYPDGDFDTEEFWALMDIWRQNNTVLVSECSCPLSGKKVLFSYKVNWRKPRIDKLYLLRPNGASKN
jgi:site-specific DNA-adenine methylase